MNVTNNGSSPPPDDAGADMFFKYIMVIMIFVGLVGHLIAALIFSKTPFKRRPVTVFHINISAATLLLSVIGNALSLVNSFKKNELKKSRFITMCRVSTGMETSGISIYTLISVMMLGHSYFMTSYHATSSSFYLPRRIKFTTAGITFSWIFGLLLGIPPSWLLEDLVVFDSRVTCQLSWVGKGSENVYWILLFILSICVPGLISLAAYALTRRLVPGPPDPSTSNASKLHSQIRSNKLNNRLVLSLFISILPYFIFGFFTTIAGDHFLPPFLMLFLEIISKSYIIHVPFIFLVRSRTYRAILGNILSTGSLSQVTPTSSVLTVGTRSTERYGRRAGTNSHGNRNMNTRRSAIAINPCNAVAP